MNSCIVLRRPQAPSGNRAAESTRGHCSVRGSWALGLVGALAGVVTAAPASEFVLVQHGRSQCVVVAPRNRSELDRIALNDFVTYVKRSTGAELPVIDETQRHPDVPVVELRRGSGDSSGRPADRSLSRHAFRYQVTPTGLSIIAADPGGLAKGVHWFLREKIGVRWFMPTELGEEVPRRDTVKLKQEDLVIAPEFEWVRMTGNPEHLPEEVMWGVRHGDDILDGEIRNNWFRAHNWFRIVPPSPDNVERHPEWFAREEGELPEAHPLLNVDISNPEVIDRFVAVARAYFDADPRRMMFSLEPNDDQYFGNSKSLGELRRRLGADAISTDEFIWFCNRVAAGVRQTHPDKRLGFYAYGHHMWAPRVVKPDPMLSFMMCRHGGRSCSRHSLLDARNPINAEWRRNFEAWCSLLTHPGYYAYWGAYSWFGPEPLGRLAEDLPYLKQMKVHQLNSENRFSWSTNAPYYYLALRLVQETGLDASAILDEFYQGMYGAASEPMKRYWTRWSKAWDAAPPRDRDGYHYDTTFRPALVEAAYGDLDQARRLADGQPQRYQQRVQLARVGLVFTDRYLRMYRQARDGAFQAAIETGKEIEEIILDTANRGRPAPLALHPNAEQTLMALDRLRADVNRYRMMLGNAKETQ